MAKKSVGGIILTVCVIAGIVLFGVGGIIYSYAINTPTKGITYALSEDGSYAKVVHYRGNKSWVVIAEEYEGVPVTEIGAEAFRYSKVKRIKMPNTINTIGDYAFANTQLKGEIIDYRRGYLSISGGERWVIDGIVIDKGIYLGDGVFYDCPNINGIIIGREIKRLDTKSSIIYYYYGSEYDYSDEYDYRGEKIPFYRNIYFYSYEQPEQPGRYWHYKRDKPAMW